MQIVSGGPGLFDQLYFAKDANVISNNYLPRLCHCIPDKSEFFTADLPFHFKARFGLPVRIYYNSAKVNVDRYLLGDAANGEVTREGVVFASASPSFPMPC